MNKQNCGKLVEKLKQVQTLNTDFNLKAEKAVSLDTSQEWNEEEKTLIAEAGKVGEEIEKLILELEKSTLETTVTATYIRKDENNAETSEIITIDFEKKLEYSVTFYKTHHIDLPENFREIMTDIWDRNIDVIQKTIEEQGFDEILLVPGGLSVSDVHDKMSEGYFATPITNFFALCGGFERVTEKTKGPRIILIHKKNAQNLEDRPELKNTLGQKTEDFVKSGQTLTLTDYLIYQRQFFEETGEHLDESGRMWLPGSTFKMKHNGDIYVVNVCWESPWLDVKADDRSALSDAGCRSSHCFT